ncbi:MAG: Transcriptional regulator, AsnC family, partial [uncultured Rubrobacteraceae bacterium]
GNGDSPRQNGAGARPGSRPGHARNRWRHRGLLGHGPLRPRRHGPYPRLREPRRDRTRENSPGPRRRPHRDHGRLPRLLQLRPGPRLEPWLRGI